MKTMILTTLMMLTVSTVHASKYCSGNNAFAGKDAFKNLASSVNAITKKTKETDKRVEIDRTAPEFKALNAIGVVQAEGQSFFGSGFLISPCHVLTNKHVAYANPQEAEVGANVRFSVGQSSTSQFSDADIAGKVIALGNYDNNDATRNGDWVVVKLSKSIGNKVGYLPYTQVKDPNKLVNRPVLTVGFPGNRTNGGKDFSKIYGDLNCKITNMNALEFLNHTCQNTGGQSGSPILAKDSNGKYYAIGMISGDNGFGMAGSENPNKANMAVNFLSGADLGTQTQGDKIAAAIAGDKCE